MSNVIIHVQENESEGKMKRKTANTLSVTK